MLNPTAQNTTVAAGLKAICLFPAMHRYSMHDPRVDAASRKGRGPTAGGVRALRRADGGVRKKLGLPSPFDMRFSNPLDLHPIALRYPRRPFVVPHFGAGFPREALMLADLFPTSISTLRAATLG